MWPAAVLVSRKRQPPGAHYGPKSPEGQEARRAFGRICRRICGIDRVLSFHGKRVGWGLLQRGTQLASELPKSLQRLVERIAASAGNPLDWSRAARCALIALGMVTYLVLVNVSIRLTIRHRLNLSEPELATLAIAGDCLLVLLGVWAVLGLSAYLLRHRYPESPVWAHLPAQGWSVTFALVCYAFGTTSSPVFGSAAMGGAFGGILLFGWRPTALGILSFVVCGVSLEAASHLGFIPYAPVYTILAFEDGHRSASMIVFIWTAVVSTSVAVMVLFGYIFARWRDREEQLAEAHLLLGNSNARLQASTDLIRRYVPAQLAEQILSGSYVQGRGWERRKLALFFSDIKGFTDASDELEAEDLSRVLNEYLSEMSAIAERYGATLDKFVGDAIMIFFGAPAVTDDRDHALRAVRMAMEMQTRMGELARKWSDEGIENPFQVRIGINTGVATVGNFGSAGRMEYTAIGKQVNLAARLESNCTPGKILISHSTWALIKDEIDCRATGEIQVKGIHHPVKTYEVG